MPSDIKFFARINKWSHEDIAEAFGALALIEKYNGDLHTVLQTKQHWLACAELLGKVGFISRRQYRGWAKTFDGDDEDAKAKIKDTINAGHQAVLGKAREHPTEIEALKARIGWVDLPSDLSEVPTQGTEGDADTEEGNNEGTEGPDVHNPATGGPSEQSDSRVTSDFTETPSRPE
jgi:hypothetical protein